MNAAEENLILLYKLIKHQRGDSHVQVTIINFKDIPDNQQNEDKSQSESWADYFKQLTTPSDWPHFCKDRQKHTEMKYLLL